MRLDAPGGSQGRRGIVPAVEPGRPRAISLLPAATEIVGALGLMDRLVGVSHECDFPDEANSLPRITRCPIHGKGLSSAEVDRWVSETLAKKGTLYTLDYDLVRSLAPEVVLTQRLCDVCAVDYGTVESFARTLPDPPRVVNLEPSSLEGMFANVAEVAEAMGEPNRAAPVIAALRTRVEAVKSKAATATTRPRCVLLEWVDPPFCAGHWGPELVALAGGTDPVGRPGTKSARIPWEEVVEAKPEVLVLALCGWKATRALEDLPILLNRPGWADLPAVRAGRVFAVDADAYFSRPGPRLVDSLEILASLIHPEVFGATPLHEGVLRAPQT
jgi:iron complex transport system substrate-binding protein